MKTSNILTIVTINLNNLEGLKKTFKSVVSQTKRDFEYIIIDGASNDGSKEFIENNSTELNQWISEPDNGIYNAMNKGITKANGEYLLFLNSGDELINDEIIETVYDKIENYDLIYFDIEFISNTSSVTKCYPSEISFSYLYKDTLPHPGTFIKRDLFSKVGLYDENLKIVSDWKFFILALTKYNATYKKYNYIFSKHYLDGISTKKENQPLINKEREEVLISEFQLLIKDTEELLRFRKQWLNKLKKKIKNITN